MRAPTRSLALVLLIPAAVISAQQAGDRAPAERVVPVHEEPRHHLVFDTPLTKILDVQIHPGDITLFHTHSDPILYVSMSASQTRSQALGAEWSGGGAAAAKPAASEPAAAPALVRLGRMTSVTSYAKQPLTHRVNNVGQTLFRLIGITNATAGDPSTAPSADFAAKPEIENPWFRGYRWMPTREAPLQHRHANPVAIVLIKGTALVDASSSTLLDRPGTFVFVEANTPHRIEGRGEDVEVVEVEVRRPR